VLGRPRLRSRGRCVGLAIAVTAVVFASPGARPAPLTFNTALPVATGQFVLRGQTVLSRSGDDPGGSGRERSVSAAVATLGFGASSRLALFATLQYLDKELGLDTASGRATREASGVGDLALLARYTLFRRDARGRTLRLAPFAGVELPAGADGERDALGRVPAPLQPGSGALDGVAGLVVTWQTLALQLDTQLAYRRNGEGNGFRAGDEWRLDGSLQVRLWPRALGERVPGFLYGVLEAGLAHRGADEVGGTDDPDSGGTTLTLTPGLQYVTRRWILEAGVGLPVIEDLEGAALGTDFVVRAGFRVNF